MPYFSGALLIDDTAKKVLLNRNPVSAGFQKPLQALRRNDVKRHFSIF